MKINKKLRKNKVFKKIGLVSTHGYFNKKYLFFIFISIFLVSMRVGYAILSQELNIKGYIVLKGNNCVYVKNIIKEDRTEGAIESYDPKIEDLKLSFDVCLESSIDNTTYKITIYNKKSKTQLYKGIKILNLNDTNVEYNIKGIKIDEEINPKEYKEFYITFTSNGESKSCIGIKFELLFEDKEEISCDNVVVALNKSNIDFSIDNKIEIDYALTNNNNKDLTIIPSTTNPYVNFSGSTINVSNNNTANGKLTLEYKGDSSKDPKTGNVVLNFKDNYGCTYSHSIPTTYHNIKTDDVIPESNYPEGTITLAGLTITSYGNGEYELNGTNTQQIYIRLSDCFDAKTNANDLYNNANCPVSTILNAGQSIKLEFNEISGSHNITQAQKFKIGLRGSIDRSMTRNLGYDLISKQLGSGILGQEAGMATLFIDSGFTFINYRFKVSYHEVDKPNPEYIKFDYNSDNFIIKLYDNYEVEIDGIKNSTDKYYIQIKNDFLYISTDMNNIGENSATKTLIAQKKDRVTTTFKPISGSASNISGLQFSYIYYANKAPNKAGNPTYTNLAFDLTKESSVNTNLNKDAIAYGLVLTGANNFNNYKFSLTTEKK